MMRISIFAIFFLVTSGALSSPSEENYLTDEYLIRSWRSEKLAVTDIDSHYCRVHLFFSGEKCKKGSLTETRRWKDFISQYQKGDEIWFFVSPPRTWEKLMGRQGYAIFRADKLVAHINTLLN